MKTKVTLHNERTIWPEMISYEEAKRLEAVTPPETWAATYMGSPSSEKTSVFQLGWFPRFNLEDQELESRSIGLYVSADTAFSTTSASAQSALIAVRLQDNYSVEIVGLRAGNWGFNELYANIVDFCSGFHWGNGKFRGCLIENRASGISLIQSLRETGPLFIRQNLVSIMPTSDKLARANLASVWVKNQCVKLPENSPWLNEFEGQVAKFPQSSKADIVDSLSRAVIYLENIIREGWELRMGYDFREHGGRMTQKQHLLNLVRSNKKNVLRFS